MDVNVDKNKEMKFYRKNNIIRPNPILIQPVENVKSIPKSLGSRSLGNEKNLKITNYVVTFNIGCCVDLDRLSMHRRAIKFNKKNFIGVLIRLNNTTCVVFHPGKMNMTGAKTYYEAKLYAHYYRLLVETVPQRVLIVSNNLIDQWKEFQTNNSEIKNSDNITKEEEKRSKLTPKSIANSDGNELVQSYKNYIDRIAIMPISSITHFNSFIIRNVIGKGKISNKRINLQKFNNLNVTKTSGYDPEVFPAVNYRITDKSMNLDSKKITANIFDSGNIIFLGARSADDIYKSYKHLMEIVTDYEENDEEDAVNCAQSILIEEKSTDPKMDPNKTDGSKTLPKRKMSISSNERYMKRVNEMLSLNLTQNSSHINYNIRDDTNNNQPQEENKTYYYKANEPIKESLRKQRVEHYEKENLRNLKKIIEQERTKYEETTPPKYNVALKKNKEDTIQKQNKWEEDDDCFILLRDKNEKKQSKSDISPMEVTTVTTPQQNKAKFYTDYTKQCSEKISFLISNINKII